MSAPSEPQIFVRPGAEDSALEFWWDPPASDGGSAITGYVLEANGSSWGNWTFSFPADASNTTITTGADVTFVTTQGIQVVYGTLPGDSSTGEVRWRFTNTGVYKVGVIDVSQNYSDSVASSQLQFIGNATQFNWWRGYPSVQFGTFLNGSPAPTDEFKIVWDLSQAYHYYNSTLLTTSTRAFPGNQMRVYVKCDTAVNSISLLSDAFTIPAASRFYRLTGLTNYTDYTFSLRAGNTNGFGPAATYRTVQPGFRPDAPTDISATRVGATNTALVTWQNAAYAGTVGWNVVSAVPVPLVDPSDVIIAPVEGYVQVKTVGGLDTTKVYKFLVQGVTDAGWGPYDAFSNTLTLDVSGAFRTLAFGGSSTVIMKSDDGLTWTDTGQTVFTRAFAGAYDGIGRWVAVGTGANSIATSTDSGNTWTGLGTSVIDSSGEQYFGSAVAYGSDTSGGTVWVAGAKGPTNTLAYSTNGTSWTGLGNTVFDVITYSLKYGADDSGNGIWVAGGEGTTNTLAYSRDGIHWNGLGNSIFDGACISVDYNGFYWVAVGNGSTNTAATSFDGINWTPEGTIVDNSGNPVNSVHWGGRWYRMGGNLAGNTNLAFSQTGDASGSNWQSDSAVADTITGLTYNGAIWLSSTLAGGVYSSSQTWGSPGTLGFVSTIFDITSHAIVSEYATPRYRLSVGVGIDASNSNTLVYSSNGKRWIPAGNSIFSTRGNGIAYGMDSSQNRIWVAVGEGTNSIARSIDGGVTWAGQGTSIFSTRGWGVFCDYSNRWLAGGEGTNTIATSRDGLHWTGLGNILFDYAKTFDYLPNGVGYLAGGNGATNTLAYSDASGASWTGLGTSVFSTMCNRVRQGPGSRVVAVGQGTNTLAYTTDSSGLTWTGLGTSIFSTAGYDVAFKTGPNVWVAVGEGTNQIAYSTDNGASWTGLGTSVFGAGGVGLSVAWDQFREVFLATGAGPNGSIATSSDGVTWTIAGTDPFVGGFGTGIFQIDTRFTVDQWQ